MLEKMIPIIAEQLNVNESEIKAESNFKDDLPSIVTVNDVVEYLKGKGVA